MQPILEVRNLWKQYKIGGQQASYLSLRERLIQPFQRQTTDTFWALQDINFDVFEGECIGIIGRNGAGKSTLLKILSQITPPTKGYIKARGRIASLLEVGTGFHPELTGRENIYLNGSILGLKRTEINAKFDEIVDFSGIGKFLDTPLKHYSSGMKLRLAFSVAAHLEPEILLIDEVLAVGDAEFQKKCLGKMDEVSKSGRTVIFVSHNLGAVRQLCDTSIWLNGGQILKQAKTPHVIQDYLSVNEDNQGIIAGNYFKQIAILNEKNTSTKQIEQGKPMTIQVSLDASKLPHNAHISLMLVDKYQQHIANFEHLIPENIKNKNLTLCFKIEYNLLIPENYSWNITLHIPNVQIIEQIKAIYNFSIIDTGNQFTKYADANNGFIMIPHEIQFQ